MKSLLMRNRGIYEYCGESFINLRIFEFNFSSDTEIEELKCELVVNSIFTLAFSTSKISRLFNYKLLFELFRIQI